MAVARSEGLRAELSRQTLAMLQFQPIALIAFDGRVMQFVAISKEVEFCTTMSVASR